MRRTAPWARHNPAASKDGRSKPVAEHSAEEIRHDRQADSRPTFSRSLLLPRTLQEAGREVPLPRWQVKGKGNPTCGVYAIPVSSGVYAVGLAHATYNGEPGASALRKTPLGG